MIRNEEYANILDEIFCYYFTVPNKDIAMAIYLPIFSTRYALIRVATLIRFSRIHRYEAMCFETDDNDDNVTLIIALSKSFFC